MLSCIFREMHDIRPSGDIRLTLNFGDNRIYEVIAIPVIQFIIGDCKRNDMLCGRMGGHMLQMKGLCRDCDISPNEGDDLCIGEQLKCQFHTKETIVDKSKEELYHSNLFLFKTAFLKCHLVDVSVTYMVALLQR